MIVEKILKGTFKPDFDSTAKEFSNYLIGNGYKFSVTENQKFTVNFENDVEFDTVSNAVFLMEAESDPQQSLKLDYEPEDEENKEDDEEGKYGAPSLSD